MKEEWLKNPIFDEQFSPNRTLNTLSLEKTSDKTEESSGNRIKTARNKEKILDYLKDNGRSNCDEIAAYIGLSPARTRVILSEMKEIEALGENRNRIYRLK